MNLNQKQVVKLVTVIILLFLTQNIIQAQVFTRILDESETIDDYLPWYFNKNPNAKIVPPVDVEAILERDKKEGRILSRYGIESKMELTEQDGGYFKFGNYTIWKMLITSENAKSLNFTFSNLNLPKGCKMFIYGMNERMIHGPIIAKNVHEGIYASDFVYGGYAVIEVFLFQDVAEEFSITINNVIQGIKDQKEKAFGDSLPCNVNTSCSEGTGWENEINAVCKILAGSGTATGTLINDECSDLTPYLLTANHVVTQGGSPSTWLFRFNYETTSCTGAVEPGSGVWITFFGADKRASWGDTDFALLELKNDLTVNTPDGLSFAGWDRRNIIPSSSMIIHHPKGDVKKITFDAASPIIDNSPSENSGLADNASFKLTITNGVNGDFGVTEVGTSGAAQFNSARQIVGQHYGAEYTLGDGINCSGDSFWAIEGRFFNSWTGGGTNGSRLSNWLGETQSPPLTIETLPAPSISGDDVICTSSENYVLQNPIPGRAVTWNVSPTFLFSSSTSGNGVTATLLGAGAWVKGAATLTYTLYSPNCGTQTITKELWVGKPSITGIKGLECFVPEGQYILQVNSQGALHHEWTFPDCQDPLPSPECWNYFNQSGLNQTISVQAGSQPVAGDMGTFTVSATNKCGTTTFSTSIIWCKDDGNSGGVKSQIKGRAFSGENILLFPNPVKKELNIELNQSIYSKQELKKLQLLDIYGKVVFQKSTFENALQINVQNILPGVFYLRAEYKGSFSIRKVIIL